MELVTGLLNSLICVLSDKVPPVNEPKYGYDAHHNQFSPLSLVSPIIPSYKLPNVKSPLVTLVSYQERIDSEAILAVFSFKDVPS